MRGNRVGFAVGAALTALLAVWASAVPDVPRVFGPAFSGPVRVLGVDDEVGRPTSEVEAPPFRSASIDGDTMGSVVGWTAVALVVLVLLFVLAMVLRELLRMHESRAVEADDHTGPDLARVRVALTTDAGERLAVLGRGTPAEGIVAAWDRLEDSLRDAGVPLPVSRTSTETAVGVLRRFAVDEATLQTLAALYREAAWSLHPLTETDREAAEAALGRLDADLRTVTSGHPEPAGA
ncbi:DUF4129 domain-containing protein [Phycicoccus sonneratiae]|uniref:DUF4129 domain-containing protein n=1 Tax=Phycicoccus sonneratiae TaxID=2807628 RepID=A0ABS2CGR8_9MICO|nr:DUF4129 domain-containing protein [Phycicoccus sonneraticus]MBM6399059.1 DUF4129 domain-containing protein [Phycicoccus sonneraticus]